MMLVLVSYGYYSVSLSILTLLCFMSVKPYAFHTIRYNKVSLQIHGLQSEEIFKRPVYPELKNGMTYFYLKKILLIDDKSLVLLIIKYPWLLYLNVETNLKPTVSVLKSFGFRQSDVKRLIAQIPSILAINHEWTLPEKLISIQKMFYLSRNSQLVKVVLQQPLLLTSSIDRNFAVASYLTNEIGLSPDELYKLILIYPRVTMIGLPVLTASWSVLTDIYGFTEYEAKTLIIKYPKLLSNAMLKSGSRRMQFIRRELGVQPPFDEARKVIQRFPPLLYLDLNYFLITNVKVLKYILKLNSTEAITLMSLFPQLLGYNPTSLDKKCCTILYFLTGLPEYAHPTNRIHSQNIVLDNNNQYDNNNNEDDNNEEVQLDELLLLEKEVVANEEKEEEEVVTYHIDNDISVEVEDQLFEVTPPNLDLLQDFFQLQPNQLQLPPNQSITLNLPFDKAVSIIRQTPWLLAYRFDRSLSVLLSLKISLEMTDVELTRCLSIYPRLTSLSITGKLRDLLVELAVLASPYIRQYDQQQPAMNSTTTTITSNSDVTTFMGANTYYDNTTTTTSTTTTTITDNEMGQLSLDTEFESLETGNLYDSNIPYHQQVRKMIREVVLKYPLLLGCSLERLRRRSIELSQHNLPYVEIINLVRRTEEGHDRWIEKRKHEKKKKESSN